MVIDHWRDRVHGPGFALLVARCQVHGVGFTVYPPGWVPYGRQAVAPAQLDGGDATDWSTTMFADALDVAAGRRWTWEAYGTPLSWTTEYRQLDRCMLVVGVATSLDLDLRHGIAETLGVPLMALVDAAVATSGRPAYVTRAGAVQQVIGAPILPVAWRRVLVAGHLAGVWGLPRWVGPSGVPEMPAHRGVAGHRSAIPSTTSARDPPGPAP